MIRHLAGPLTDAVRRTTDLVQQDIPDDLRHLALSVSHAFLHAKPNMCAKILRSTGGVRGLFFGLLNGCIAADKSWPSYPYSLVLKENPTPSLSLKAGPFWNPHLHGPFILPGNGDTSDSERQIRSPGSLQVVVQGTCSITSPLLQRMTKK